MAGFEYYDFEYYERPAQAALRPYLAELAGYAYPRDPPVLHRGLPSEHLTVVLTLDDPLSLAWPDAPADKYVTVLGGLHSRAIQIRESLNVSGIQLSLTPAASRALFGVPPGVLAQSVVELDDVLGGSARELVEKLRSVPTWEQRFDLVEQTLLEAWRDEPLTEVRPELGWAWRRLRETGGQVSVHGLADEVGWSRRHLTDRFQVEYGLAPKVAARVMRIERAYRRLRARPGTKLADLAADTGFADQAHLTREWHAIIGCAPRQWLAEEFPNLQDAAVAVRAG